MEEIIIAATNESKLDFWLNVIDISTDLDSMAILMEENNLIGIKKKRIKESPIPLILIVGDESRNFTNQQREDILADIKEIAKQKKMVILNKTLAKQLSISPSGLHYYGVRAIVEETMSMILIANVLQMVYDGGIYIEPIVQVI
ncbi:MAG: hypothetical protein KBT36_13900 [Kurthia sp.]|nr:hypothetical protein [Candidatus Kurthia equi]